MENLGLLGFKPQCFLCLLSSPPSKLILVFGRTAVCAALRGGCLTASSLAWGVSLCLAAGVRGSAAAPRASAHFLLAPLPALLCPPRPRAWLSGERLCESHVYYLLRNKSAVSCTFLEDQAESQSEVLTVAR